ncbi:hypothetical protein MHYP_G00312010 [Metynnis hypsauchen]
MVSKQAAMLGLFFSTSPVHYLGENTLKSKRQHARHHESTGLAHLFYLDVLIKTRLSWSLRGSASDRHGPRERRKGRSCRSARWRTSAQPRRAAITSSSAERRTRYKLPSRDKRRGARGLVCVLSKPEKTPR